MLAEVRKGLFKARPKHVELPADSLTPEHLSCKSYGHFGIPESADSLAYDPIQRLLAVSPSIHDTAAPLLTGFRKLQLKLIQILVAALDLISCSR